MFLKLRFQKIIIFFSTLVLTSSAIASFIESTIGTAVVNDATATYYNPAALTLVKSPQFISLNSLAYFHSQFKGETIQKFTGFTQSGGSSANTNYFLPSLYFGLPTSDKITLGFAVLANSFNRESDDNSILRYVQSNNSIQNYDFVPAIGIKVNESISVGAGVNFSYARFLLKPTIGFPILNIPDSQSRNDSKGKGIGGNVGLLLKPSKSTMIGFDYRSAISYRLSGKSIFETNPPVISNNYNFKFWTPARSVISINQFLTPKLGLIGTVQYIQWNLLKKLHIHNIATRVNSRPIIIPNANIPFHLHNSWVFTLGSHYRLMPKWIVRVASTYLQSPGNPHYQIVSGDNVVLGASTSYEINKHITVDGSYAHAFIQNEKISISNNLNIIDGINSGSRDAVSLKLTINL